MVNKRSAYSAWSQAMKRFNEDSSLVNLVEVSALGGLYEQLEGTRDVKSREVVKACSDMSRYAYALLKDVHKMYFGMLPKATELYELQVKHGELNAGVFEIAITDCLNTLSKHFTDLTTGKCDDSMLNAFMRNVIIQSKPVIKVYDRKRNGKSTTVVQWQIKLGRERLYLGENTVYNAYTYSTFVEDICFAYLTVVDKVTGLGINLSREYLRDYGFVVRAKL